MPQGGKEVPIAPELWALDWANVEAGGRRAAAALFGINDVLSADATKWIT